MSTPNDHNQAPDALFEEIAAQARAARRAAPSVASASTTTRDRALRAMAAALRQGVEAILAANARDVAQAREEVARGELGAAFVDRLALSPERVEAMAAALEEVADMADPVGREDESWLRPNGLRVARRRIPLGVIGIIYEARPNVTSDAAGLCLKAGNAVILKGGQRALESNRAVVAALRLGLAEVGLDPDVLQFVDSPHRDSVRALLVQEDYVDLIIPRGGEGLVRYVSQHSRIPVIKHYKGVCHVYLDAHADPAKALDIVVNAKVQRPSVCNSAETLLVHASRAADLLPAVADALVQRGVRLHLDPRAMAALEAQPWFGPDTCAPATDDDFLAEYLSLDIAVAVVDDLDAAIAHIQRFGSDHTEAIVTDHVGTSEEFLRRVNSSVVLVNASTRFADGGQLGLGAEIGISTTKLHAFGPMGLRELTTTKFVIRGDGQVRG